MRGINALLAVQLTFHGLATIAHAQDQAFNQRDPKDYIGDVTNDGGTGPNDINVVDDGGLDITFGSELSQKILSITKEHCGDKENEECKKQIQDILGIGPSSNGLQRRISPFAGAAGAVAAVVGKIITSIEDRIWNGFANLKVVHIKLSKEEKEQIGNWKQTDSFQYKHFEGDTVSVSLDNSQPMLSDVPTMVQEENGDITIDFKGLDVPLQKAWSAVMCTRDGAISLQCLVARIRTFLRMIQTGGDANQFMWLKMTGVLNPKQELLVQSMEDLKDESDRLWVDKNIASEDVQRLIQFGAFVTYADTVANVHIVNGQMKWSKSWIETQEEMKQYDCPEGDKRMFCSNCGGDSTGEAPINPEPLGDWKMPMGKCIGLGEGEKKGLQDCECFKDMNIEAHPLNVQDMENFYNLVMNGNSGGGNKPDDKVVKSCYKQAENIRADPSKWAWSKVKDLEIGIEEFCSLDFVKGDDTTQRDYPPDKITRDNFRLKITHKGIDPPDKNTCIHYLRDELVYGCDHDEKLNQFDYKWGGTLTIPSTGMEFEVYPMTPRLQGLTDSKIEFECKTFSTREDKDNKGRSGDALPDVIDDKMMKQMCVHSLYEGWRPDSDKLDCGGYYNIVMEHSRLYDSPTDCWTWNYACISDLIQNQNSVIMRATHFTHSDGHTPNYLSQRCWIGFDNY